ncbi:MAG: hypothetical protein LBR74_02875 [Eubacterium sp.]|jgi:hypothetical protein|nr:hypothetical protein [Eubacterium sp.]
MTFSVHTFELRLTPSTDEFSKLLKRAFEKSKGKHRLGKSNRHNGDDVRVDNALMEEGIKIEYHYDHYKKKVKFIVNPSRVLGGDDLKLWKPHDQNLREFIKELRDHIDDYFDSMYSLDDFELKRIDFTINIDVGSKENVTAYIKALQSIGRVKGFSPKYIKTDKHINRDQSFDLEGNSNGIEFTIYDKVAECEREKAAGILRVEVRLKKSNAISRYTDKSNPAKQIRDLAKHSKEIFLDTFQRVVPPGDLYKKKRAVSIITESDFKQKMKDKMLTLLELIPTKKSLYLAQKEMNDRNIAKVMQSFVDLDLSPVTLSKRHNKKHLKSLYKYL